jgi:hypothetical protein
VRFKLLACDVITRETCLCVARCAHTVDPVFTRKGEHNVPGRLRELLQGHIDAAAAGETEYDAVLLGYGLCGNATLGLAARRFPLVIPRAHDCTTLFLGSKAAFLEHFADNPSQPWASTGYAEHGGAPVSEGSTRDWLGHDYATLIATYGEENARYILETMHVAHDDSAIWFIDVPETRGSGGTEAMVRREADASGRTFRLLPGSLRLIEGLLAGDWSADEYLVVPPGHCVRGIYDMDEVMRAAPEAGEGNQ